MLQDIIGQDAIKKQVCAFEKTLRLDKKREDLDKTVYKFKPPHMAFLGNPGTGKTSIARVMATVLKSLGVLSKGHLVEVQRSDLVGSAIGQTGPKTQSKIDEAKGGVLFVDAAYRLTSTNSEKDFGREALDQLMQSMSDGDPVMIFAGYEQDMKLFIDANPGLFRRIQKQFTFADYSVKELAQIFCVQLKKTGFTFEEKTPGDEVENAVCKIITAGTVDKQRSRMNAGMIDQMMQLAKEELDSRLDLDAKNLEKQICNFTTMDLEHAVATLKTNWERYEMLDAEVEAVSTQCVSQCPKMRRKTLPTNSILLKYGDNDPSLIRMVSESCGNDMECVLAEISGDILVLLACYGFALASACCLLAYLPARWCHLKTLYPGRE